MKNDNKELLEGLVEEVAKAIAPMWFDEDCQGHWVAGYWEERQKSTIEQAKAVLSVIAPHYEKQIAEQQKIIKGLWNLLDDIDTLDDAAKDDDTYFRKKCYELQQKRWSMHTPPTKG